MVRCAKHSFSAKEKYEADAQFYRETAALKFSRAAVWHDRPASAAAHSANASTPQERPTTALNTASETQKIKKLTYATNQCMQKITINDFVTDESDKHLDTAIKLSSEIIKRFRQHKPLKQMVESDEFDAEKKMLTYLKKRMHKDLFQKINILINGHQVFRSGQTPADSIESALVKHQLAKPCNLRFKNAYINLKLKWALIERNLNVLGLAPSH